MRRMVRTCSLGGHGRVPRDRASGSPPEEGYLLITPPQQPQCNTIRYLKIGCRPGRRRSGRPAGRSGQWTSRSPRSTSPPMTRGWLPGHDQATSPPRSLWGSRRAAPLLPPGEYTRRLLTACAPSCPRGPQRLACRTSRGRSCPRVRALRATEPPWYLGWPNCQRARVNWSSRGHWSRSRVQARRRARASRRRGRRPGRLSAARTAGRNPARTRG